MQGFLDAAKWSYVDHCPARPGQGFESQSRPAQSRGCEPGFVPPMCDTTTPISGVKVNALGTPDILKIGSWQPLQPLAVVDQGSGADVSIDRLVVNGQDIDTKFDEDTAAGAATVQQGLGLVSSLTYEALRSGANKFPPSPLVDQTNKLWIYVDGTAAAVVAFDVYWGNPAINGSEAVGNMQKNGGANYYG